MKRIITATLLAMATACGAPEDFEPEGEVIGTLEQAIYMPSKYGIEGITDWQGHPDFGRECEGSVPSEVADHQCAVPDSKNIKLSWSPSTCPTTGSYGPGTPDGFRSVVYDAINYWVAEMTQLGWNMNPSGTAPFGLKCQSVSDAAGKFAPGPTWDQHGTPYGTLSQYRDGKVYIDSADIASMCGALAPGSVPARYDCVWNHVMHELYHVVGLGHSHAGPGPNILNESMDGTWVNNKFLSASQISRLECYNPANGGLFPDC